MKSRGVEVNDKIVQEITDGMASLIAGKPLAKTSAAVTTVMAFVISRWGVDIDWDALIDDLKVRVELGRAAEAELETRQ